MNQTHLPFYHAPADQTENCHRRSQAGWTARIFYWLMAFGRRRNVALKKYRPPYRSGRRGAPSQKISALRPETLPREKRSLRARSMPAAANKRGSVRAPFEIVAFFLLGARARDALDLQWRPGGFFGNVAI